MAHINNAGYAIVDTDPNTITELQSGHIIKIAVLTDGTKIWRFVVGNTSGSKWVEVNIVGRRTISIEGNEFLYLPIKGSDGSTFQAGDLIFNGWRDQNTLWGKASYVSGDGALFSSWTLVRNG